MGRCRVRLPDWQTRLTEVVRAAAHRPFNVKTWNCATFARQCVLAVTQRDLPTRLTGTLEQTADHLFDRVPPRLARRGDVVLCDIPQATLGICVGRRIALVGVRGLIFEPMRKARIAWSV